MTTIETLTSDKLEAQTLHTTWPVALEIKNALKEAAGNKKRAAQILKIGRNTLYKRLQEMEIP